MFWWQWWVDVAIALGTIGAVLVALFGQAFRAKFFPPRLSLQLSDRNGEATRESKGEGLPSQPARYYHVQVSNARRWSPARDVRIVLLQVEEPGPDGEPQVIWRGDIPFGWRHGVLFPIARTIGPNAFADLVSVRESRRLQLHLLIAPFNLEVVRDRASTLILTLQARGNEAESSPLRVKIAWDGEWNSGEVEMRRHMKVD
jgi:hypothetical protein